MPRKKLDRRTEDRLTANIDSNLTYMNYLNTYKKSFDILIDNIIKSNDNIDLIAFPILFIARHCMELGLKTNIRYFSQYSGKNDYVQAGTHDLNNLFNAFKMHVEKTFIELKSKHNIDVDDSDKKSFKDLCDEVENLNGTFHSIDRNSDAFRYPVNKIHKPSIPRGQKINLLDVKELLDKSITLFKYTSAVFSKYIEYIDEINKYYEELMMDQYERS